jgi:hypothetical protein
MGKGGEFHTQVPSLSVKQSRCSLNRRLRRSGRFALQKTLWPLPRIERRFFVGPKYSHHTDYAMEIKKEEEE